MFKGTSMLNVGYYFSCKVKTNLYLKHHACWINVFNRQISYGCFNATFQRKDNTDDVDTDLIILGLYPRTTATDSAICSLDTLSGPPTFRRTWTFLPSAACTLMSVTMVQWKAIAKKKNTNIEALYINWNMLKLFIEWTQEKLLLLIEFHKCTSQTHTW